MGAAGAGMAAGLAGCTGGNGQQTTEPPGGGTSTPGGGGTPMDTATPSESGIEHIQPGDTGETVHILTDYSNDPWQNIWENDIIPTVGDEIGVDFQVEYAGFQGTGEQRLTTLIQAGDAPESYTSGLTQLGDMLAQGQIAAATHIVDYLVEQSGELVGEPYRFFGDEMFLVPHGQYTDSWHYRTDILEDLGLEIPETNEELLHNAQVIDESEDHKERGLTISAVKAGQSASQFEGIMQLKNVWYYRWKDEEKMDEAEVWFPKKEIVEALEWYTEAAQYSPDPTSVDWGSTLSFWAGSRVGQMYHLNGWGAGVAANADNLEIARNTDITPFLTFEGIEPELGFGNPGFDGHPAFNIADNVPGWFSILRYMYEDPSRAAKYYAAEPTRFIPVYADIMDTDAYQESEIFQTVPNLLDLNFKARDVLAPLEPSAELLAYTPASNFALRFNIQSEMTNQVVVGGRDPEPAWQEAHDRFVQRLEEGKQLVAENF